MPIEKQGKQKGSLSKYFGQYIKLDFKTNKLEKLQNITGQLISTERLPQFYVAQQTWHRHCGRLFSFLLAGLDKPSSRNQCDPELNNCKLVLEFQLTKEHLQNGLISATKC